VLLGLLLVVVLLIVVVLLLAPRCFVAKWTASEAMVLFLKLAILMGLNASKVNEYKALMTCSFKNAKQNKNANQTE